MTAYGLRDTGKAQAGPTAKGFEFLGCEVIPGLLRPSMKSRKRLLGKVEKVLRESVSDMKQPARVVRKRSTLVETLAKVSNIVKGWSNQYSYCNDRETLRGLDQKVDDLLDRYLSAYRLARARHGGPEAAANRRRLLGVHLIADAKDASHLLLSPRDAIAGSSP